jgi:hypothetical protein
MDFMKIFVKRAPKWGAEITKDSRLQRFYGKL